MCMYVRDGLVKFWLEPRVELADDNGRMKVQELRRAEALVEKNKIQIVKAWNQYFES